MSLVSAEEKAAVLSPIHFAEPEPEAFETLVWHDAARVKPDHWDTVLCWGTEGFCTGYWDERFNELICCESGCTVVGVTHWALPNGPHA